MSDHDLTPPTAALAPEEWAKLEIDDGNARYDATFSHRLYVKPHGGDSFEARERHALAALCLYQQPFGFTPGELKALTLLVTAERPLICSDDAHDETDYEPLAASAVAKIRALLPEEPR